MTVISFVIDAIGSWACASRAASTSPVRGFDDQARARIDRWGRGRRGRRGQRERNEQRGGEQEALHEIRILSPMKSVVEDLRVQRWSGLDGDAVRRAIASIVSPRDERGRVTRLATTVVAVVRCRRGRRARRRARPGGGRPRSSPRQGTPRARRSDASAPVPRPTSPRRPISPASRAASAPAAARKSRPSRGRRRSTERDALTSALAGPLVKARARSPGLAALRADARQQQDRLRHQLARLADRPRMRRPDDGADRREAVLADEVGAPVGDERGDVLPHRPSVGERHVLDVAARVRGLDDAEDARCRSGAPRPGTARPTRGRATG